MVALESNFWNSWFDPHHLNGFEDLVGFILIASIPILKNQFLKK